MGSTMVQPLQVLCVGPACPDLATSAWGPFTVHHVDSLDAAAAALNRHAHDAVLVHAPSLSALSGLLQWPSLAHVVLDAALLVVAPEPPPAVALKLIQRGVQEVLPQREAAAELLARALRQGVERKQIEQAARRAHAIDLATGLPNLAQLREHVTHLLALREREPAPMAVLALHIDGLSAAEAMLGAEAANVLRRKVAVRIRSALRASDVVAAIGGDDFVVMLAWIDALEAGAHVARKLTESLAEPLSVAGGECAVAVRFGLALYPQDGRDVDALLRCARDQAALGPVYGRAGTARGAKGAAANDEGPASGH